MSYNILSYKKGNSNEYIDIIGSHFYNNEEYYISENDYGDIVIYTLDQNQELNEVEDESTIEEVSDSWKEAVGDSKETIWSNEDFDESSFSLDNDLI